jgi:hypothetical protein
MPEELGPGAVRRIGEVLPPVLHPLRAIERAAATPFPRGRRSAGQHA